jgi:Tfp pilus assembly protein PilX
MHQQRGVALFFALISMLAIMLAAVALVRSVDTSTIISGNLAFQQAATASADSGTEAAITWLSTTEAANAGTNYLTNAAHPFNNDAPASGYYSSLDPTLSLTTTSGTHINWDNTDSKLVGTDSSGNTTRYVIQRMCRTANVAVQSADCMLSAAIQDNNGQNILLPQEVCKGAGCPAAGQAPQIRITSRTTGPRNALSYVQAYVY